MKFRNKRKKTILLIYFTTIILFACGCSNLNRKGIAITAKDSLLINKNIFTLYKKKDSVIFVAKSNYNNSNKPELNIYQIDFLNLSSFQKLLSTQQCNYKEIQNIQKELFKKYNWTPYKSEEVLFIQIQPKGYKNDFELLDTRQEIELIITDKLMELDMGEC